MGFLSRRFCTVTHSRLFLRKTQDLDGSGIIRYTEFLAATIEAQGAISEVRIAEGGSSTSASRILASAPFLLCPSAAPRFHLNRLHSCLFALYGFRVFFAVLAFDRLDSDDSGYISIENLTEILGDEFPKEDIEAIIEEASTDNDGKISYAEFLALWENREDAIADIRDVKGQMDSERSGIVSALSGDESEPISDSKHDVLSRASFIDEKLLSVRKLTADTMKRVKFGDVEAVH